MNRFLLLLFFMLPTGLAAQGVLSGRVVDAAGGSEYLDDAALIGAVALPANAPPFNEITAAQWQDAFTALSAGSEQPPQLGGELAPVTPTATFFGEVQGDGSYRLEGLPLETRLGVAAKVGEIWWPLREEIWLTQASSELTKQIDYFRLGADPGGVRIESYRLDAFNSLRPDLRYGAIRVFESLRIVNPDPTRAAMVHIELRILIPPGMSARNLPSMYGSLLSYMQGWSAKPPVESPMTQANQTAWTFGTGGGMHGQGVSVGPGAHTSADNWHPLNSDPVLAMVGAGDTEYRIDASPNGRAATLVFDRPVPPALNGMPGVLHIHVAHNSGVLLSSPGDKVTFERMFEYSVLDANARIAPELTLSALVEGAHRRLYGEPENNAYPPNPEFAPNLKSGELVKVALGFNADAQLAMREMEERATGAAEPDNTASQEPLQNPAQFDWSMLFKSLAFVFGLAFVGALVATLRWPREKQLKRLAELPATRKEVLEGVNQLELEYKEGKLPARAYSEHRQRLLNRLVELDARGKE